MNGLPFPDALHLIRESRVPLIMIPRAPSTDALAAGLATLLVLERLGKSPHLVSPEFQLPPNHGFLPKSDAVRRNLSSLRSFIVSVNTRDTKLDSLSYDLEGDQLRIYLTPKNGYYEPKDVTTSAGAFAYDLIILLGLPSLSDLGELYEQNAEFFYQTPIITIDHQPSHSRFGQVNLVDVVASSISEIVFETIRQLDDKLLDEHIATSLLAGIISNTKGFQTQSVTPRSLSVASHLISAGARRDVIIRHLYQTKTLPTLRVWGRALANIQADNENRLVWTTVTREDLKQTDATPEDAAGALDELMINTPTAETVVLFVELNGDVQVHISLIKPRELKLPETIQPETPNYYTGKCHGSLRNITSEIINTLTKQTK